MNISEYDLSGKVAFVTGAGRGIGKGIAQVLAEAGADVVINALTPQHVEGLAADIGRATGRRVMPLVADVTRPAEVERAIARIVGELGALHILVNNLGDAIRKPLVQLTDEELRTILDLNFTATALCSRAVGPHMNGIGPGLFPDPVTVGEAGYRQRVEDATRTVPLGREGRLREVGLLALYLASSASDYMTGQTLYLDGGLTL